MNPIDASLQYAFDLAELGYNHHGGKFYKNAIEKIIKSYKL